MFDTSGVAYGRFALRPVDAIPLESDISHSVQNDKNKILSAILSFVIPNELVRDLKGVRLDNING